MKGFMAMIDEYAVVGTCDAIPTLDPDSVEHKDVGVEYITVVRLNLDCGQHPMIWQGEPDDEPWRMGIESKYTEGLERTSMTRKRPIKPMRLSGAPTAEELAKAKAYVKGAYAIRNLDSSAAIASTSPGGQVAIRMTNAPGARASTACDSNSTERACAALTTISTSTSAPSAAAFALSCVCSYSSVGGCHTLTHNTPNPNPNQTIERSCKTRGL